LPKNTVGFTFALLFGFNLIKVNVIMKKSPLFFGLLFVFSISFLGSCEEKETTDPKYDIPDTYNFENVSYQGQTDRLAMLLEMKNYMQVSRTGGQLDAVQLKAMYENDAANAGFTKEYTKQIKSKTFEGEQAVFEALIDELAAASTSTVEGSDGQSGVIKSLDGAKSYLIGDDGLDHAQLIEKGLMGACFYYQATSVYMGPDRMNVDNEIVEEGEGTAMEHHWDEAFGYFGVPKDFPTNKDGIVHWGDYSNKRDAILGSNQQLIDALLKGRAAISNKDLDTRDEAIQEAREIWELVSVTSALHYLNSSLENFDDMALLGHALSEGIGFTYALKFNLDKKIDNNQIDELLKLMGGSASFAEMNLYQITKEDLMSAKQQLAKAYQLEDKMDEF